MTRPAASRRAWTDRASRAARDLRLRAGQVPPTLLLALPFSLVAGLAAGALVPAVAARAAQVTDSTAPAPAAAAAAADSTTAADDSAHPERRTAHRKSAEPANDDLGVGDDAGDGSGDGATASTRSGGTAARSFDPADPGLVYRYPTVTGQTVSPPARVTSRIAQTVPLPAHSGKGRRIVYSAAGQHLWIVDGSGAVLRDYPVTGRVDRPGPGSYAVYSKSAESYNPIAKVSFTHMVRFAYGVTGASIGFHSIPRWQNGKPLQTPESLGLALGRGGCIRQTEDNADFLYRWSRVGDRVVVVA